LAEGPKERRLDGSRWEKDEEEEEAEKAVEEDRVDDIDGCDFSCCWSWDG
jgi:hypothetical protein